MPVCLLAVTGLGLAVGPLVAQAGAATPATRVGGAAAVPSGAVYLGALKGSTAMNVDVVLQPRDPAALATFATAVSTPGNALYRHYIAAGAFPSLFGPTASAISAVRDWLRSVGLKDSAVSADHLYFSVTASATQFERAFSIGFNRYDVRGRIAYANTQAPLVAGSAASAIQGILGLDDLTQAVHSSMLRLVPSPKASVTPQVVTGGPQPCTDAKDTATDYDSYTADQLASAYRFTSLYEAGDEGAGVTVALFELASNLNSDIKAYQACFKTSATVTYIKEDGGTTSQNGSDEAVLDIEDVIGLAPKAAIDVYRAPNSETGLYDNYDGIVAADSAKVISTSWGECESSAGSSVLSEEATLFEKAASQGQSVFAAAGDDGDAACYPSTGSTALAVLDPASQPYVTGVGGTTLETLGPPPTQEVWNESALEEGAGGGGVSASWAMPSYQTGAPSSLHVINSNSSGTPCGAASGSYCREVPDVSADADPQTGYVIYYEGGWTVYGGTSAAAPLWAAFTALTDAWSGCSGGGLGFANPTLYKIAGSSSYAKSFSDITSGNNDYFGAHGGLYPAGTAYDMASGLGTPIGSDLPSAICGKSEVSITYPAAKTSTEGASATLQIKATDSDGDTLSYSASGLPTGVSINSTTGKISGTPTAAGKDTVIATVTDSAGASAEVTFTWTVKS
jgi:subtilase family serine protease